MVLLGSFNIVMAVDVTLDGMDSSKSIGNQGVMVFNDSSKGLCVDKDTYINFGDSVPVTPGTAGITNATKVKSLIIHFYRNDMTKQEGYDLQGAIWYFTDGVLPANPAQQSMVNTVLADSTNYPDSYSLLLNNVTVLKNNQTSTVTKVIGTSTSTDTVISQIDQITEINSVITPNGQTTESSTVINWIGTNTDVLTEIVKNGNRICTITTTTLTNFYDEVTTTIYTSYFKNTTTTDITTYFKNTTTIKTNTEYKQTNTTTETWESTLSYLDFTFDSIQKPCKQELIKFTAIDRTVKECFNIEYSSCVKWNTTDINVKESFFNTKDTQVVVTDFNTTETVETHDLFNKTEITVNKVCKLIPENNTVPTENETSIPMQDTGMPVLPLLLALVAVMGGFAYKIRK